MNDQNRWKKSAHGKLLVSLVLSVLLCCSCIVSAEAASMWSQTYGGEEREYAFALVAAPSGGYAIAGYTSSLGAGSDDFWLVKTDPNGVMEWNKTYGGTKPDNAYALAVTPDGGYAIAGASRSFGNGYRNFWLVKTDSNGIMEWNKTYGEMGEQTPHSLEVTSDWGYAIAGTTYSVEVNGSLLVKTDALGNVEWKRTYSGGFAFSLVATLDKGYAMAGTADASAGGNGDFWLAKTDSLGNLQWSRTYGGTGDDMAYSLVAVPNGGYAVAGVRDYYSPMLFSSRKYPLWDSSDAPESGQWSKTQSLAESTQWLESGNNSIWLVKTDSSGIMEWNRTYGEGAAYSLIVTSDGEYAMAGYTIVYPYVCWLVRADAQGDMRWIRKYEGGTGYWMHATSLVAASDGGYAVAGCIYHYLVLNSNMDFWLIKTDEFGVVPEGLTVVIMVSLSTVAVIVGTRHFRKRPKSENCRMRKP